MPSSLSAVNLAPQAGGKPISGLVSVHGNGPRLSIDENAALHQAKAIGDIDYVFFRRFSDSRSSQVSAFVIDNSDQRYDEQQLAQIHKKLWLNCGSPLLYVGWPTRVDVLSCARGPDFWQDGQCRYQPAETIETASQISEAMLAKQRRFSSFRLVDGTFWDDPANSRLARVDKAAHRRLIGAVVETDNALNGDQNPLFRRLLLLIVLVKYLEDRGVFPQGWFDECHKGAGSFFDVLKRGTADEVRELLGKLERKFNGDVFALPDGAKQRLSVKELRAFADLIEARTIAAQGYLWEQFSFRYIPVEVLSHLYQRFAQRGNGAVFTPPFVASIMLDFSLPYDRITGSEKILDPTCGSGVFLVGAFRRLVQFWRNQNGWKTPDVATLKAILKKCIFGIEMQAEAIHLTAFSLALAMCDALQPNVIWKELRFDKLADSNLLSGDFFDHIAKFQPGPGREGFSVVIGNPPFQSRFSAAAQRANESAEDASRIRVPDKQMAYLIAEQAMSLLKENGRLCLLQPSGFLYNEKTRPFQKRFIASNRLETVLDFTSIRGLYDGADPKTVALVVTKRAPSPSHSIHHYTFRRTFSVEERISFELDHYDRHLVPQAAVVEQDWIWRINLLGGGRLRNLAARLKEMRTLSEFIAESGWSAGEGFIVGDTCKKEPAPWLTGKAFLPTEALSADGLDSSRIGHVTETLFAAPRTEARYHAPLVLIKEHDSLPCAFWNKGFLGYKDQIVGVSAAPSQATALQKFCDHFNEHRSVLRAFCLLFGTKALVGKATAIVKRDIDALPWPKSGADWDLSAWEKILCDDTVNYTAEFVRLGQDSQLLSKRVVTANLDAYASLFVKMLGSVYEDLRAERSILLDGLACQVFCFGKSPELEWPTDWTGPLKKLIYVQNGEALRTVRIIRFYDGNVIFIVKPDRLRYWICSTAIRDADETLAELRQQGY